MYPLGIVHLALAVAALLTGLLVTLARKGTRYHRRLGWAYTASMLGLNGTALMIYRLFGGFGPFHVAAVFSLATLVAGMFAIRTRRPAGTWLTHHAYMMAWSYVGLLAAAAAEILSRVPASPFWGMVGVATGVVVLLGKLTIDRTLPPILARYRH